MTSPHSKNRSQSSNLSPGPQHSACRPTSRGSPSLGPEHLRFPASGHCQDFTPEQLQEQAACPHTVHCAPTSVCPCVLPFLCVLDWQGRHTQPGDTVFRVSLHPLSQSRCGASAGSRPLALALVPSEDAPGTAEPRGAPFWEQTPPFLVLRRSRRAADRQLKSKN